MILVLFGTNPYSFDRLAKAIEKYVQISGKEMVAQLGNTTYRPKGIRCFNFMQHKELIALINKAELIVTQGGFGSILDCLERKKRIVVVPRKRDFGECQDDGLGQEELTRALDKARRIVGVYDVRELPKAIERAWLLRPDFEPNTKIPQLVLDFVKSVTGQK
jgi:UDP-N-acetylglucosamine transferase subunit ALG13